jgi:C2 domain
LSHRGSVQQYRVKPFPDPDRVEETKWMSKEQLIAESLKRSTHWVEGGSGHVGKLYLEILGCEGLPNMDAFTANPREATDAFACVVFEDAIVNTAIIPDCLSPRWMPWCRRAFVFNITHPSSTLLIGLFDFDPEKSPLQLLSRATGDLHDAIGRIVIRLSNYRQGIDYTTAVRFVVVWTGKDCLKSFTSHLHLPSLVSAVLW